jgi:hypothetical protein
VATSAGATIGGLGSAAVAMEMAAMAANGRANKWRAGFFMAIGGRTYAILPEFFRPSIKGW